MTVAPIRKNHARSLTPHASHLTPYTLHLTPLHPSPTHRFRTVAKNTCGIRSSVLLGSIPQDDESCVSTRTTWQVRRKARVIGAPLHLRPGGVRNQAAVGRLETSAGRPPAAMMSRLLDRTPRMCRT